MTNRLELNLIWAQSGTATDPDLDTTHPIYQPNKFIKGWIVEKEPHQWQNYLSQITDLKQQLMAAESLIEWDSTISYQKNAVCRLGESFYVNSSGAVSLNKTPATAANGWLAILSVRASVITDVTSDLNTRLNNHLAADNPHNDNIHTIGGYESQEIDDFLGLATDPRTIVYHEAQMGRTVHMETPAQLGTLPVAGGTFSGDVKFIGGINLNGVGTIGQDGPDISMSAGGGAITLEADGDSVYQTLASGVRTEITTVANFETQQQAVNYLFALGAPMFALDVRKSLSHLGSSPQNITTTADPVFEANGMTWATFITLSMDGANFTNVPTTCYIVGWNGTKLVGTLFTSAQSNWNAFGAYMSTRLTGITHVQYAFLYPQLSLNQQSTLLR